MTWRRVLRVPMAVAVGLSLILAACGGDDEDEAEATSTTAAAEEEATTTTAEAEEETTTTAAEEEETTTTAAAEDDAGIGVVLNDDFAILLDGEPTSGSVTFNVSSEGPDFPHALTIVRAASIDDLPRNEANGAIDTEAMDPADIIGSTNVPMPSGTAEDLTVELEAGDYVFFCPVQNETRSHVAAGQIIAVTVGG